MTPIRLRGFQSFHVAGRVVRLEGLPVEQRRFAQNAAPRPVDPNGDHVTGQMYAQAWLNEAPSCHLPVLLWHGGGMTGANWESTPDGRDGWLAALLAAGFDVVVSDAMERGRASWSRWPQVYDDAPLFRSLDEGWDMFRLGPPGSGAQGWRDRTVHPGQQFPVEAFERFAAQWVPRWIGHEEPTMAAYDALLERMGPCLVVGHSQGGGFALEMARRRPDLVRGVVALEPSGAPIDPVPGAPPHLFVWGDFIDLHPTWVQYRRGVAAYALRLRDASASASTLDLPREGITGNSHFPMMDRNSDLVARKVIDWLAAVAAEQD